MAKSDYDIKLVTEWKCPEGGGAPIIAQPNIVKPLHHVNPRNIVGQSTWNQMRRGCYALANMTCEICGKKLEKGMADAHELYDIDYEKGISIFVRTICTCRLCHRYGIHSGRCITLHKAGNPLMPKETLLEGAENVFRLVYKYNKAHPKADLRVYVTMLDYLKCEDLRDEMEKLIKKYKIKFYKEDLKKMAKWAQWKLRIGTREYPTPYKNEKEWKKAMEEVAKNDTARIYGAKKKKYEGLDSVEITEKDLDKINGAKIPEGF